MSYGPVSRYGNRAEEVLNRHITTPEPTDAKPGTEAKIVVLERRAELKQHLFHPKDFEHGPHTDECFLAQ